MLQILERSIFAGIFASYLETLVPKTYLEWFAKPEPSHREYMDPPGPYIDKNRLEREASGQARFGGARAAARQPRKHKRPLWSQASGADTWSLSWFLYRALGLGGFQGFKIEVDMVLAWLASGGSKTAWRMSRNTSSFAYRFLLCFNRLRAKLLS